MIDFSDAIGSQLRLLIYRAQYDRQVASEVDRILTQTLEDVADAIASPSFRNLSQFDQQRKLQLFREVGNRLSSGYNTLTTEMVDELSQYHGLESQIAKAQIAAVLPTGSSELGITLGAFLPTTLTNSIASLSVQGNTLPDWFAAQLGNITPATVSAIQQGLVQGMSVRQISANILDNSQATNPLNQAPNILARARRDATAITRTATTAVHNDAAQQSYIQAGPQVTNSYRFVAVRDSRTTPQCRAADGKIFRYDDPDRLVPPLHWNCRSTSIPVMDGAIAKKLGLGDSTDHSMQSYSDWLKSQSSSEQNSILGPSRAAMFRSGSLSLANAIDQDGRTLTLDQLRDAVSPLQPVGAS